jgi:hypothetical protein
MLSQNAFFVIPPNKTKNTLRASNWRHSHPDPDWEMSGQRVRKRRKMKKSENLFLHGLQYSLFGMGLVTKLNGPVAKDSMDAGLRQLE